MISLNELLQGTEPSDNQLTQKYYRLMNDKLNDFLDNVLIDIPSDNKPVCRWIILKDEYDRFNDFISWMINQMLTSANDANKIN